MGIGDLNGRGSGLIVYVHPFRRLKSAPVYTAASVCVFIALCIIETLLVIVTLPRYIYTVLNHPTLIPFATFLFSPILMIQYPTL
jgi:hypothetical protein